ncbi:AAA family ATPase [Acidovorax sp.]|uniref:AAA family ATPase n=1 Tax=Acidovorax sp. TaxID=1872122 RepID=UPI003D06AFB9
MPEEPSPEAPSHPSIDSEFAIRNCLWCSNGQIVNVRLLLPLSVNDEELRERSQRAAEECLAWEERQRRDKEAQTQQAPDAADGSLVTGASSSRVKEPPQPSLSKVVPRDLDIDVERAQLECADGEVQLLLSRSFDEVTSIAQGPLSWLHVPVYAWDEPLKLLERAALTPDKELHRRGKDLYRQLRKSHVSQGRPVGYPLAAHESVLNDLKRIGQLMPHFAQVLSFIRNSLILSHARKQPMCVPPILMLGDPGIGKTHFSIELAKALQVPVHRHAFDSGITETALTGSDSRWSNTSPGLMFEALVLGPSASPVILLDEIDKARKGERADPVAPLHTLLEPVSARAVTDISVNFTFDASHVVWIATGNQAARVPSTIRSRFREFLINAPQGEAAILAAHVVAQTVLARMGPALFDPPDKRIVVALAHLPARQQIQALETAFAQALANGSRAVQLHHLPANVLGTERGHEELQDPQALDDSEAPPNDYLH